MTVNDVGVQDPRRLVNPRPGDWVNTRLLAHGPASGCSAGSVIPTGFQAVVRVLHPAGDGRSWAQIAAGVGRVVHPLVQWPCIASHFDGSGRSGDIDPEEGSIPAETLEAILEHCAAGGELVQAVWSGFGSWSETPDAEALMPGWGGRSYLLFATPKAALTAWPGMDDGWPQSANIIWPSDRSWCIATEIDWERHEIGPVRHHVGVRESLTVAVAASTEFLDLDESWAPLAEALADVGIQAQVAAWEDPGVDWGRYDLVAVMYAWGYVTRREAFLDWVESAAAVTTVVNDPPMLRWNSDKTYLGDLAGIGIPVVPTVWVPPGAPWEPPAPDYVIKPSVASGGLGAARYHSSRRHVADGHVRRLHDAGHTAMVQPYHDSVDAAGETALVFIGGRFSHAVTKAGLLGADAGETERLWEREVVTPGAATPAQQRVAEAVMATVTARFGQTVYGRIDLVDDDVGRPRVLEAELVEPSLFLAVADGAAQRLAAALGNRIGHST